ncbi:hypothetical protein BGZ76_011578 [Entomortierella beljakovae]|nr:hypothetical protein BGZ76_011578 [Entomortierella beljakovae]
MSDNTTNTEDYNDQVNANASISAFTSALWFNVVVAAAVFIAFCIVRHWNRKIYQPRTYLVQEDIRSPELPKGIFSWITTSLAVKDHVLADRIGLDSYMFLRFLRMSAILFFGFTIVAIPVLIPLNVINGAGEEGLKAMTIGNVKEGWRIWFHLFLTIFFCGATVFMLWKEMLEYTRRRHAYLLSSKHASAPQSTTILVTAIPKGLHSEEALFNIFNRFPGGVRSIWINRDPEELIKLCEERDQVTLKLEAAEYTYVQSAYGKPSKNGPAIKEPERPIGRTSAIPFVGPKVDLIDFYSKKLSELNMEINKARQKKTVNSQNSAFIRFHTQFGAHSAVQTVVHPTPFTMAPMYAEISPLDVAWDNMNLSNIQRKGRSMISLVLATALALLWSIPVVFVSSIANIDSLVKILPFLAFLNDIDESVKGIIQGILPPLFMAILMALLPIILTQLSKFEGHSRYSSITMGVMSKYFVFLVINVLLISTLAGGFFSTWSQVKGQGFSPIEIINILSIKLPQVSTFFVTYALLQGLVGPMLLLLQIAPLVLNYVFTILLAKNPRQIWNVQGRLSSVNFGTTFPPQLLMFSIGIIYSTIAPLILPFVTFYFAMYYFSYRHMFLYVFKQPVESGGLAFPLAVKQAFTGIFIFEIVVFGIFLAKLADNDVLPQVIILLLLIIVTIYTYFNLGDAFSPLVTYLPVALFSKDLQVDDDGIVHDGSQDDSRNKDNENVPNEKRAMTTMDVVHIQEPVPERTFGKQEFDEAEVSSQLAAFPTPNPSLLDSTSISRQSANHNNLERIDSRRNRPVSYAPSIGQNDDVDIQHNNEDPILLLLQEQAYCHPAFYSPQTPIWLPLDERGLVSQEITRLAEMGIVVSTNGAHLDPATGKSSISGIVFAPGEESQYRLERGE